MAETNAAVTRSNNFQNYTLETIRRDINELLKKYPPHERHGEVRKTLDNLYRIESKLMIDKFSQKNVDNS